MIGVLFKFFSSRAGLIVLGVLGLLLAGGIALNKAYEAGVESERSATRQAIIDQLKERSETNAEIRDMDISELCGLIGGSMSDDGECI